MMVGIKSEFIEHLSSYSHIFEISLREVFTAPEAGSKIPEFLYMLCKKLNADWFYRTQWQAWRQIARHKKQLQKCTETQRVDRHGNPAVEKIYPHILTNISNGLFAQRKWHLGTDNKSLNTWWFTVQRTKLNMHEERCPLDIKYEVTNAGWETRI